MGKETGISWTDHTFNPWWGCTKVSPGCDHCYAETVDAKYSKGQDLHWGKGAPRRSFGEAHWRQPIRWNKDAELAGVRRKVFCASMADVMDDEAPAMERERLWQTIDQTPNLIWQLLTKRPHRYTTYLPLGGFKHNNVMLGTTIEMQEYRDPRMEALMRGANELYDRNEENYGRTPTGDPINLFVSYEPALGSLRLGKYADVIDWLIFGGETGADRRQVPAADLEQWAREIKGDCELGGVAFFMKQMSAYSPTQAASLIPVDMLIRNFPESVR